MHDALKLTAGGREIKFRWDVEAWLELEDSGHSLEWVLAEIGKEAPHRAWLAFAAPMANSGARHAGEAADITPEWLGKNLTPNQLQIVKACCKVAYAMGCLRKSAGDEDEDEEVDAVLEKLQKKKKSDKPPETV